MSVDIVDVAVVAKDRTDFFEVALGKGGEDDQSTAQALGEAFVEATHLKDERRIEGGAEPVISGQNNAEERRNQYGRLHKRNVDPGMSVLQDSVLGMQANGTDALDSYCDCTFVHIYSEQTFEVGLVEYK